MAAPTNSFLTYTAKGIREDLSDVINNIDPTDTPFFSSLRKEDAENTYTEWQIDHLDAAANNAQAEGNDAAFEVITPTIRTGNYCQISAKYVAISRTLDVVRKAGRKRELNYQTVRLGLSLRRDIETALTTNATYASTDPRQTRGLPGWLQYNCLVGTGGAAPNWSTNTAPTAGTARAITEALVKTLSQNIFTYGGNPTVFMVNPATRVAVSAFSGNATRFQNVDENELLASFDFYETEFQRLRLVPNRFSPFNNGTVNGVAFLLDLNYWALRQLRPMNTVDLAPTGDAYKRMLVCEYALMSGQDQASGQIRDLTT